MDIIIDITFQTTVGCTKMSNVTNTCQCPRIHHDNCHAEDAASNGIVNYRVIGVFRSADYNNPIGENENELQELKKIEDIVARTRGMGMSTEYSKVMASSCHWVNGKLQMSVEQLYSSSLSHSIIAVEGRKLLRLNQSNNWTGCRRHDKVKTDAENNN